MSFIDDDRPQKKVAHEIGADLSTLIGRRVASARRAAQSRDRENRSRGGQQDIDKISGGKPLPLVSSRAGYDSKLAARKVLIRDRFKRPLSFIRYYCTHPDLLWISDSFPCGELV